MHKILLLLFVFMTVGGLAQPGDSLNKNRVKQPVFYTDSILEKLEKFKDSILRSLPSNDSFLIYENNARNITALLEVQKKQRAKEKRGAMIRIGTGIALFIILIIGLRRKASKK